MSAVSYCHVAGKGGKDGQTECYNTMHKIWNTKWFMEDNFKFSSLTTCYHQAAITKGKNVFKWVESKYLKEEHALTFHKQILKNQDLHEVILHVSHAV